MNGESFFYSTAKNRKHEAIGEPEDPRCCVSWRSPKNPLPKMLGKPQWTGIFWKNQLKPMNFSAAEDHCERSTGRTISLGAAVRGIPGERAEDRSWAR